MRWKHIALLVGCGSTTPTPVANREPPQETTPTFELRCGEPNCWKPRRATVSWVDKHTLAVALDPPILIGGDFYTFAVHDDARIKVEELDGNRFRLTIIVAMPPPASLEFDATFGRCVGDLCDHLDHARAVINLAGAPRAR